MSGYVVEALTDSRMHESDINPYAWQLINSGEGFRMTGPGKEVYKCRGRSGIKTSLGSVFLVDITECFSSENLRLSRNTKF